MSDVLNVTALIDRIAGTVICPLHGLTRKDPGAPILSAITSSPSLGETS